MSNFVFQKIEFTQNSSKFHQTIKNFYALEPKNVWKICEHIFFWKFRVFRKLFMSTFYMLTHVDTSELKNSNIFICDFCDFKCCKKSLWDKHVLTRKHKNVDKMLTNVDIKSSKKVHTCHCGKLYSHRQSLSIHKKICPII
jgi:hypothetical protein